MDVQDRTAPADLLVGDTAVVTSRHFHSGQKTDHELRLLAVEPVHGTDETALLGIENGSSSFFVASLTPEGKTVSIVGVGQLREAIEHFDELVGEA